MRKTILTLLACLLAAPVGAQAKEKNGHPTVSEGAATGTATTTACSSGSQSLADCAAAASIDATAATTSWSMDCFGSEVNCVQLTSSTATCFEVNEITVSTILTSADPNDVICNLFGGAPASNYQVRGCTT